MKGAGWWALVAGAVALALFVEWHTDEVTVVLAVMSVMAVALGALRAERALVAGAILGFSIIAAHAVTEAMGTMRPSYMHSAVVTGDSDRHGRARLVDHRAGLVRGLAPHAAGACTGRISKRRDAF